MNFVVFLLIFLWFCWLVSAIFKAVKKNRLIKLAKQHLDDAPAFANDLIDCYVKFHGRVVAQNQATSPLRHQPCVFYQSKVFAEWQTKLKKPQRGMTTNRKTLYSQQSNIPLPLELVANNGASVQVDFTVFDQPGNVVELSNDKFKSAHCPELCSEQAQAKYQDYVVVEKWLKSDAAVIIYGKLQKSPSGQLSLTPTEKTDYPSVFKVYSKSGRKLDAELSKKLFLARIGVCWRIGLLLGTGYLVMRSYL